MALRLTGKQNYAYSGNLDKVRAALGIDISNNIGSDDGVSNISYFKLGLKSSPINPGSSTYNNPFLTFQRETQSPANNDAIRHVFRAQNDAHEDTTIALWNYSMPVVTDGAETGKIQLRMKLEAYAATRALLEAEGDNFRILDDKKLTFGDNDEAQFEYDEDGTDQVRYDGVDMVFDTATKLLFRDPGMAISSPAGGSLRLEASQGITLYADNSIQTGVQDGLIYTMNCSHVSGPSAGFGAGFIIQVEDAGGTEEQGRINFVLTDVTNGAENADISLWANVAGTITEKLLLNADGLSKLVGSLEVENGATFGTTAFVLDNNDVDQIAMDIEAANTIADIINIQAAALTTAKAIDVSNLDALTTGIGLHIASAAGALFTGAGRLLYINHIGAESDSGVLTEIASNASDETVITRITASGNLANGKILDLSAALVTTGDGISMANLNALTSGRGLHIASSATAITGAGRLLYVQHTGVTSTSGILAEIVSEATDATDVVKITGTGRGTGRGLVVTGGVSMNPVGGYNAQEGMNNRYRLVWTAGQRGKPSLNADIQNAAEATRMIADPDFEILGTNCVSTCSAFNPEGGITLTTTAVAADKVILAPHLDANQSAWAQVTWGTDQQTRWECRLRTGASIVDAIIWAGLKLTNTAVSTTDADEAFFRYEEGVNAGEWEAVYDIANAGPTAVDTNIVVAINTDYHFVIDIASDRTAKFYIDGVLVATTAALTNAVDLIPYIGIEVQAAGAAGAKSIVARGQTISRNFA